MDTFGISCVVKYDLTLWLTLEKEKLVHTGNVYL